MRIGAGGIMSAADEARIIGQNMKYLANTTEPWEDIIQGIELPDGSFLRVNGIRLTTEYMNLMANVWGGKVTTRKVTVQLKEDTE